MVGKKSPTWNDVKAKIAEFDRANLLALVKDLYGASKDNRAFLHARFDLDADPLKPYKIKIDRWLSPDLLKNQNVSLDYVRGVSHNLGYGVGDEMNIILAEYKDDN
jgi:hypothetical protein